MRNFISTRVAILAIDEGKNPILSPECQRDKMHSFSKQSIRYYISNVDVCEVNEFILFDLDPTRLSLEIGTDSQELKAEDQIELIRKNNIQLDELEL